MFLQFIFSVQFFSSFLSFSFVRFARISFVRFADHFHIISIVHTIYGFRVFFVSNVRLLHTIVWTEIGVETYFINLLGSCACTFIRFRVLNAVVNEYWQIAMVLLLLFSTPLPVFFIVSFFISQMHQRRPNKPFLATHSMVICAEYILNVRLPCVLLRSFSRLSFHQQSDQRANSIKWKCTHAWRVLARIRDRGDRNETTYNVQFSSGTAH